MRTRYLVVVLSSAVAIMAALWQHGLSRRAADAEFLTNADGSMEWTIVMPADSWLEIKKASGTDARRQSRALLIIVTHAFDEAELQGRGCHILHVSPMEIAGKVRIAGACRAVADRAGVSM